MIDRQAPPSMTLAARCLCALGTLWLLDGAPAYADPQGSSSGSRHLELYFHGDISAWYGAISGVTLELAPGGQPRRTGFASIKALRASLGLGARGRSFELRLGPAIDLYVEGPLDLEVFNGGPYGISFGVAGQLDWRIVSCWRIGPRLSIARGEGDGVTTGRGTVATGGVHARNGRFGAGIDMIHVSGDRESGAGIMAGVGLDGRAGKYGLAVAGGGVVIAGITALIMLFNANIH
jgi:hypothetical protein